MPTDRAAARGDDDDFPTLLRRALAEGSFVRLVLARNRVAGAEPKRVAVRLLRLRGAPALSFTYSHATRDETRNTDVDAGVARVGELLATTFSRAHLSTATEDVELRVGRKGVHLARRARADDAGPARERGERGAGIDARDAVGVGHAAAAPGVADAAPPDPVDAALPAHDRSKRRWVDIGRPWLVDLGVTDASHRLVPALARKWKQIDKFVEIVDHALRGAGLLDGAAPVRVADFGCGKGYLTFAVHEHLARTLGLDARTTGVERRADLVALANRAARRSAAGGLAFVEGDLRSHPPGELDVMIALHACDTATDHAIDLGLRAGARVLVCSPCCHQELRPQMRSPAAVAPVLRHGVHLGQQAEMVTDSLRALLLEAEGYDARVFEFVALEHTSKNKMILAVKREAGADPAAAAAARAEIGRVKDFYGIRVQCLEGLRGATGPAATGPLSRRERS